MRLMLLFRGSRKTERRASILLNHLAVRAAPFALFRNPRKTKCGARMFRAAPFALLATALFCRAATDPLAAGVQRKFDQIGVHQAKPGSVVLFTQIELNAWARVKVAESFPQGMRSPLIELGNGEATGSALVDFLKMRSGQGKETGWLISRLIEGERPLKVWVRLTSAAGKATVHLTRVDLSGATLSGRTLDFLIDNFFRPRYPDAKIGEPFELEDSIERVEVQPAGLRVVMRK